MFSELLKWLAQGALDTATYEAWYALGALVLTALGIRLARLKGAQRHIIWALGGAATSIATLLIIWLILIWSGQTVLLGSLALGAVVAVILRLVSVRKHERARLAVHRKGYFDFKKALNRAVKEYVAAQQRFNEQVRFMTSKMTELSGPIDASTTEDQKEVIAIKLARAFRSAATKNKRHAAAIKSRTDDFVEAMTGILELLKETNDQPALGKHYAELKSFQQIVIGSKASAVSNKARMLAFPKLSQQLNAAIAEFNEGTNLYIAAMDSILVFAAAQLSTT
jgi:hypothetical protein